MVNEISIPYHLAIPALMALAGLLAVLFFRKGLFATNKLLWLSISVFLLVYFGIVGSATFLDIYYQWNLNRYDLDHDGFFGGAEVTAEQEEALRKLTNDLGRNFSVFTGLVFGVLLSVGIYVSGWIRIHLIKSKTFEK